jgi:hypothetical protein
MLSETMLSELHEAVISICDRYVHSKTHSDEVQTIVATRAGEFRYGVNSLLPTGVTMPDARQLIRQHFGL